MTGWIVLGVCGLAVAIAVATVLAVLRRLGPLDTVQRRLLRRAAEAQALKPAVAELEQRLVEVETTLRQAQEHAELIPARRAGRHSADPQGRRSHRSS